MSPKTPILLEAIDVEKHYGKFAALGGVSLQVRANTVHSVIGPNGCLLYTSPSPRDLSTSRMPSSA